MSLSTRWAWLLAAALVTIVLTGCGATAAGPAATVAAVSSPTRSTTAAPPVATATASAARSPESFRYPLAADPSWIVDQTGSPDGGAVIRLVRTDGADRHDVATDARHRFHLHPEWSADGKTFTFLTTDAADGSRSIWRYDIGQ